MRALSVDTDQGKLRVVEAPVPQPKRGEILVEIRIAGINEMDVEVRQGGWAKQVKRFRRAGPVLTGFEFAGVARSSGRRIRAGERVVGYSPVLNGPRTHAEFAAVPESALLALPDTISDEAAAALCIIGLTAIEVMERICPLHAGQQCLVVGAAGGFGSYAVQLAASRDSKVTAVASVANEAWVLSLGAHEFRPYETEDFGKAGDAFDLIIDTSAKLSFRKAKPFLARQGKYVTSDPTADAAGFAWSAFSSRRSGFLMMLKTSPIRLTRLVELAESGILRPAIDSVFDLSQADAAFDRFATRGKQGRVLLSS